MLIVDMPMPTRCGACPCRHVEFDIDYVAVFCAIKDNEYVEDPDSIPSWCPIKGELVRCGECKYAMRTSETGKVLGCKHFKWKSRGLRTENDYCSYGERKDGEG